MIAPSQKIVPLPFVLNDANFLKRLRLAAADTSRIVTLPHAIKRMRQRKVTLNQIVECLRKGTVSESAHLTPYGGWKATISYRCSGDMVSVVAALEMKGNGDYCIVITVMT